ncbi:hypothetical protein Dimus_017790 [Dionaea muscipula]
MPSQLVRLISRTVGGRESAVHLGGSALWLELFHDPASYAKERFKYEMIDGHRVELESNGNILPRDLRFAALGRDMRLCLVTMMDSFAMSITLWLLRKQWTTLALLTRGHTTMKQRVGWLSGWSLTIAGQLISVSQEAIADRDLCGEEG